MSLQQTILEDLSSAMKSRDMDRLGVLRMVKAALLNAQKETGIAELSDEDTMSVLQKEAKRRKESIDAFEKAGRNDLADVEKMELKVIEQYLPAEFTDDEIRAIIDDVVQSTGSSEFGVVMGQVMKKASGRADGNRVRQLVQEQLNA